MSSPGGVLLLAYYYPPTIAAGSMRPHRFSRYLPEHGYRCYVVAGAAPEAKNLPNLTYVPAPGAPWGQWTAAVMRRVQKVVTPYNDRLDWILPSLKAAHRFIETQSISTVLSTSPPVSSHLVAYSLKRKYGVRWIADLRDPFIHRPRQRPWHLEPWLEQLIFDNADAITTVTTVLGEQFRSRHPKYRHKVHVLWNGYDPEERIAAGEPKERDYKTLAHIGDVYFPRDPGPLLNSVERLIGNGKLAPERIRIEFVGLFDEDSPARKLPALMSLQAKGCLTVHNTLVSRSEALRATANADGLVLLDVCMDNVGHAAPTKMFDYVRAGRPTLALTVRNSTVEEILSKCGLPYECVYPGSSTQSVDEKVLRFLNLPRDVGKPSEWFEDQFDGRKQVAKLAEILRSIS